MVMTTPLERAACAIHQWHSIHHSATTQDHDGWCLGDFTAARYAADGLLNRIEIAQVIVSEHGAISDEKALQIADAIIENINR